MTRKAWQPVCLSSIYGGSFVQVLSFCQVLYVSKQLCPQAQTQHQCSPMIGSFGDGGDVVDVQPQASPHSQPGTELDTLDTVLWGMCTFFLSMYTVFAPISSVPPCRASPPDGFTPFHPLVCTPFWQAAHQMTYMPACTRSAKCLCPVQVPIELSNATSSALAVAVASAVLGTFAICCPDHAACFWRYMWRSPVRPLCLPAFLPAFLAAVKTCYHLPKYFIFCRLYPSFAVMIR